MIRLAIESVEINNSRIFVIQENLEILNNEKIEALSVKVLPTDYRRGRMVDDEIHSCNSQLRLKSNEINLQVKVGHWLAPDFKLACGLQELVNGHPQADG